MVTQLRAAGVEDPELCVKFLREDGKLTQENIDRLIHGEPIQYVLGNWEFYGLPLTMHPNVLIPRPDTEILVDTAIDFLKTRTSPTFLDLGCGSGAITLSVMKHSGAHGTALDKNPDAVALTKRNAEINQLQPTVLSGDLFDPPDLPQFDAILSNPPYLDKRDMQELSAQVKNEPETALYGGEDGLDYYRFIAPHYAPYLKAGGALILEIGHTQAKAVADIVKAAGYIDIQIHKDYGGNDRVVFCRRNV